MDKTIAPKLNPGKKHAFIDTKTDFIFPCLNPLEMLSQLLATTYHPIEQIKRKNKIVFIFKQQ